MANRVDTHLIDIPEKPNGPVAAALLAGGIGAAGFGLAVLLSELFSGIGNALNWYNPVGPLTGKVIVGVAIYLVAWGALLSAWRGKEVSFGRIGTVAILLLALGLLFTFPPFWEIFPHS